MPAFDIVIVGSGFGAAVMAARLGAHLQAEGAGRTVLVVEKGGDFTAAFDPLADGEPVNAQGNRFKHSYDPRYLGGVADLFSDSHTGGESASLNVVAGRGIGGGSNLYCGVSLRTPAASFEQVRGGRRLWPSLYSRAALDPYYDVAEQMLRVRQLQWTDARVPHWQLATKRDLVFAEGARRIGATAVPLKLADDNDANEGWWTQGQRFSGRQNLTLNYLRLARESGVQFWSGCEVDGIGPAGDGYVVSGVDGRDGAAARFEIEARIVIVAAGCVGSTALLLRSADRFLGSRALDLGAERAGRPVLGRHLSANGDYGVTGVVGAAFEHEVQGFKGKPMSSFCPSFWPQHRFIIIPFHTPPIYPAQGQISSFLPARNPSARGRRSTDVKPGDGGRPLPDWGLGYKEQLKQFGARVLTMGCLAWDNGEGEVRLRTDGQGVDVVWPETHPDTEMRWSAALDAMQSIYQALGGEMLLDGYRQHGTVNTAHPLGACRMADVTESTEGIVDPYGESFGNRNLFVVDGGIVPSALGVNPSLTIAAIAELIAARLIAGEGTESLTSRLT